MTNWNPVYVILFANKGSAFRKGIKKYTKSDYSHASISLDPSLNNMYSFSEVPFAKAKNTLSLPASFCRESIYGPLSQYNDYFTVLITFVTDEGLIEIQKKIDFYIQNHNKYKFSVGGILKYFLNLRSENNVDPDKKNKFFCSEFVTYMLKSSGMPGIDSIMKSPGDLYKSDLYVESVDYTISTFSEKNLINVTNKAKQKFIKHEKEKEITNESFYSDSDIYEIDCVLEFSNPISMIRERQENESILMNYTAFLDWKTLHESFISTFGKNNLEYKFKMIEMIIRKNITNIMNIDIMRFIIGQFKKIGSSFNKKDIITSVDVQKGNISTTKNQYQYNGAGAEMELVG